MNVEPITLAVGAVAVLETGYLIHGYLSNQVDMSEIQKHHKARMANRALQQDVNDTESE